MNRDIIQGKWHELKGLLKQNFARLTDNDLEEINGSFEELSGRLQKAYGYGREKADKEIDAFLKEKFTEKTE